MVANGYSEQVAEGNGPVMCAGPFVHPRRSTGVPTKPTRIACIEAPGLSAARETHRRDDGDDADERRESAKERGTPTKLYGFV